MPTRVPYDSGGSIVVSLPPKEREKAGIEEGMTVMVEAVDGEIHIAEAEVNKAHRPNGGDDR